MSIDTVSHNNSNNYKLWNDFHGLNHDDDSAPLILVVAARELQLDRGTLNAYIKTCVATNNRRQLPAIHELDELDTSDELDAELDDLIATPRIQRV